MKKIKWMILTWVVPLALVGQTERWVYKFNGSGNDWDEAYSIVYGADGNIYAAGWSKSSGADYDFTVISLTTAGDTNWVYRYNGPTSGVDVAYSIDYGADGNIYAAGYSTGSGTDYDFTVISLTTAGDTNWVYRYNGPTSGVDVAYSIDYGADGNIYAAGHSTGSGTDYDFTVISLTTAGDTNWVYRYNGPGTWPDAAYSIDYGADGNIYTAGRSYSSGHGYDLIVISLTTGGDTNWVYRYNGPGNDVDQANSIAYGSDGNVYVAGVSNGNGTNDDFLVISLTTAGDTNWVYRYNGPGNDVDQANSIAYGSDGNVYAAGYSTGSGTDYDFTVISLTTAGDTNWVCRYNGPGNYFSDRANSVVYGADGNIYAAGDSWGSGTLSDFTVISLTNEGDTNWVYAYNASGNGFDRANSIVYGADGNIYAAGVSYSSGTDDDFTVISLGAVGIEERNISSTSNFFYVPSFFKDNIRIKFSKSSQRSLKIVLYNVYGGSVFEKEYSYTPSSLTIKDEKITRLGSGVYFLVISSGKKKHYSTMKLIKL